MLTNPEIQTEIEGKKIKIKDHTYGNLVEFRDKLN